MIWIRYYRDIYIALQKWPGGHTFLPFWSLVSICLCLTLCVRWICGVMPTLTGTLLLLLRWSFTLHVDNEGGIDDGCPRPVILSMMITGWMQGEGRRSVFQFEVLSLLSDILTYPLYDRNPAMVLCCWDELWLHLPSMSRRAMVEQALEIAEVKNMGETFQQNLILL